MLEVAKAGGIRASAVAGFIAMSASTAALFFSRVFGHAIRDRIIADPRFLFKLGVEVGIDYCCATIAEVRKRADKFWDELEFYFSDIIVGVVVDGALVTMMAPRALMGAMPRPVASGGILGAIRKYTTSLPSSMFEKSIPGARVFTVSQRLMCVVVKFLEYSLIGIACGAVGQSLTNGITRLTNKVNSHGADEASDGGNKDQKKKKKGKKGDATEVVEVHNKNKEPPVLETALVWGLFMGVSSNLRLQVVVGLERLCDFFIGARFPMLNNAATVGIRFVNNIIGGENFIDMARWAGVQ